MLCQYKDLLGAPGTAPFHAIRFAGFSVIDALFVVMLAAIISYRHRVNPIVAAIGVFILGQMLHVLFCVNTAFIQWAKNINTGGHPVVQALY